MAHNDLNKICEICGGSGQVSFFKGVSRFLLSSEECEECAGTGFRLPSGEAERENRMPAKKSKRSTHDKG
ncbi:MAG: hypothetical protein R3297_08770 [Desulfobulbales bacterium]|nr:hypothetical protein [Desulfobulbales bacterium]